MDSNHNQVTGTILAFGLQNPVVHNPLDPVLAPPRNSLCTDNPFSGLIVRLFIIQHSHIPSYKCDVHLANVDYILPSPHHIALPVYA